MERLKAEELKIGQVFSLTKRKNAKQFFVGGFLNLTKENTSLTTYKRFKDFVIINNGCSQLTLEKDKQVFIIP